MKYLLKFIFPFFHSGVEAKHLVFSSATQHAMPSESAESGKRSVLRLGSQVLYAYAAMCEYSVKLKKNINVVIQSDVKA